MRQVAVTEGDKVEAQMRLGVEVNGYGISELAKRVAEVSDAEVDRLVANYEAEYTLAPSLRSGGDHRASLNYAARLELGLRHFLDGGGFKAFTDTFEDLHGLMQLPGIAVQRLMADGYGFGAEGDWKTAALCRAMKVMAQGLGGRHVVHGRLHVSPRSLPGRWCWARTCWRSAPRWPRKSRRARFIRWASAARPIPCGWSSPRRRDRR